MKLWLRFAAIIFAASLLAGCAGTNFARLSAPQIRLGQDSEVSVRERLGSPYKQGTLTKHDRQFRTFSYAYSESTGAAAAPGVTPARAQTFYIHDGKVVGHEFVSSWAEDSTNFDDTKIGQIVKGQSKEADVVHLLGEPVGEYIYPLTSQPDETAKIYRYEQVSGTAFSLRIFVKVLVVTYDPDGVVSDVEFTQSGQQ